MDQQRVDEYVRYHDEMLVAMPRDVLDKAVAIAKKWLSLEIAEEMREIHASDGPHWIHNQTLGHHWFGMQFRNVLRDGDLLDGVLPSGNWDDYYVQVLEIAIGVRPRPV